MVHIKNLIKKTDSTVTIVHRLLVALVRCGVCVKQKFKVGSSLLYILFRSNQTEIVLFVLVPIIYGPFQFQHNRVPTTIRVHLVHVKSSLIITYCEAQARVRQGSARDGPSGERPQSLNPCLELTLKLVATHPPTHRKSQYT